jgi:hypothetical protein
MSSRRWRGPETFDGARGRDRPHRARRRGSNRPARRRRGRHDAKAIAGPRVEGQSATAPPLCRRHPARRGVCTQHAATASVEAIRDCCRIPPSRRKGKPIADIRRRLSSAAVCRSLVLFFADYREGELAHSSRLSIAASSPSSSRSCYPISGGCGRVIPLDDRTIPLVFSLFSAAEHHPAWPGAPILIRPSTGAIR